MDIVTILPLCAQLITCVHMSPLGVTSNQMLVSSTSTPAPLLVVGPSFPASHARANQHALRCSYIPPGAPGMPPAPYRAPVRPQRLTVPYTVLERHPTVLGCCQCHAVPCRAPHSAAFQPMTGIQWPQSTLYASPLWPLHLGLCVHVHA